MPEELSSYPGAPAFSARSNQPVKNFLRWIWAVLRGKTSKALIKKYGADNWYNWALQNWGTKWGIYHATDWEQIAPEDVVDLIDPDYDLPEDLREYDLPEDLRELETVASIHFDSAWSPATRIIAKLSERYPEAYFGLIYADEGGGFVGADLITGGDCLATYEPDWDDPDGIEMRTRVGYYWPEDEEDDDDDLDSTRVPDEVLPQLLPVTNADLPEDSPESAKPQDWQLIQSSREYGTDTMTYDSREAAIAGYERIVERCAEYEPTLRRDFELISPDGEEEALSPYLGSTEPALLPDGDDEEGLADFKLSEHHTYGYVAVSPPKGTEGGDMTVIIKREDEGVVVDIWPRGNEDGESLASTYAFWFETLPEEAEWTLLMKSEQFGRQSYGYESREAAMESYEQLSKANTRTTGASFC